MINDSDKFVKNIYGEVLSEDLVDFSNKVCSKRMTYWNAAKNGMPLPNIIYGNLIVTPTSIEDDEDDEED